jgi:hypothetical protein
VAICATTWTVLPHDPIQMIDDRLWRVEGVMESGLRRIMALVRLDDGRIVIHNAVALNDEEMSKIDAWGEVAAILVPNAFHRMDCKIMQDRYPKARVYAPRAAVKDVAKATPVHGTYDDVPQDASLTVRHLPGIGDREGVLEVRGSSGLSVIFNDMITNVEKAGPPIDWFVGPTGQVSIPRFTRWLCMRDKKGFKAELQRLLDAGPARVVPGHGTDLVGADVPGRMAEALALL